MNTLIRHRRRLLPVLALLAVGLVVTACSSGSPGESDSGGAVSAGGADGAVADRPGGVAAPELVDGVTGSGDTSGRPGRDGTVLTSESEIKTAQLQLRAADPADVLSQIDALVASYHGDLDSEHVSTDKHGDPVSADLVLRVPVARFGDAVAALEDLATLVDVQTQTEDVTTQVADIDARVRNAQQSIEQLRRLFSRATRIGDIIALESQLHQRQADLESLQAQQRVLQDQTTMSTISVHVSRPDATSPGDDDRSGFLAGLHQGWDALLTVLVGAGQVVGILLPLLLLAVPLAGAGWLVLRHRRRVAPPPDPAGSA